MQTISLHHYNFIQTPIETVLEEAAAACKCLGKGMETFPLCDYMFQSVFLQMTGFQEQKMKCICWDISTIDYEFRRDWLRDLGKNGEFSSIDAKGWVYKNILTRIDFSREMKSDNDKLLEKSLIKQKIFSKIDHILDKTFFSECAQRDFMTFRKSKDLFKTTHFANDCLLEKCLIDIHKMLYNHRNKCAHNTISYQDNIPTLKALASESNKYNNYFIWFALLMLIDLVSIKLYDLYLNSVQNNI